MIAAMKEFTGRLNETQPLEISTKFVSMEELRPPSIRQFCCFRVALDFIGCGGDCSMEDIQAAYHELYDCIDDCGRGGDPARTVTVCEYFMFLHLAEKLSGILISIVPMSKEADAASCENESLKYVNQALMTRNKSLSLVVNLHNRISEVRTMMLSDDFSEEQINLYLTHLRKDLKLEQDCRKEEKRQIHMHREYLYCQDFNTKVSNLDNQLTILKATQKSEAETHIEKLQLHNLKLRGVHKDNFRICRRSFFELHSIVGRKDKLPKRIKKAVSRYQEFFKYGKI